MIVDLLKTALFYYFLTGVFATIINYLLQPFICTLNQVVFSVATYKAYLDSMFPITMSLLKMIWILYVIYIIFSKLIKKIW